jgi:hypothetical protein
MTWASMSNPRLKPSRGSASRIALWRRRSPRRSAAGKDLRPPIRLSSECTQKLPRIFVGLQVLQRERQHQRLELLRIDPAAGDTGDSRDEVGDKRHGLFDIKLPESKLLEFDQAASNARLLLIASLTPLTCSTTDAASSELTAALYGPCPRRQPGTKPRGESRWTFPRRRPPLHFSLHHPAGVPAQRRKQIGGQKSENFARICAPSGSALGRSKQSIVA